MAVACWIVAILLGVSWCSMACRNIAAKKEEKPYDSSWVIWTFIFTLVAILIAGSVS